MWPPFAYLSLSLSLRNFAAPSVKFYPDSMPLFYPAVHKRNRFSSLRFVFCRISLLPFLFFLGIDRVYSSIPHIRTKGVAIPFARKKISQTRFSYVRHTNPRIRERKKGTRDHRLTRRNVISRSHGKTVYLSPKFSNLPFFVS